MHETQLTPLRANLPLAGRTMELRDFARAAADDARAQATAKLVFTTGAPVARYDWMRDRPYVERLVVDATAIRLGRLERGAPLLNAHNQWSLEGQLGVVERPVLRNGAGECDVIFSRRESVAGYVQDVQDRVIRNVSVGYIRHRVEMVPPAADGAPWEYLVTDWEPTEVSLVPVPADMDAQVRRAGDAATDARQVRTFPCEFIERPRSAASGTADQRHRQGSTMTTITQQEHANNGQVAHEVRALVARHGLPETFAAGLAGLSIDQAGKRVLDELAAQDRASGGHLNVNPSLRVDRLAFMREDRVSVVERRDLMSEALAARIGGPAIERENPYRHARLVDMARDLLEFNGVRTTGFSPADIVDRAHTTSDFPELLTGTGNRVLRQAYTAYEGGVKRAFRSSTSRDFRAKQRLQLSEAPALLKVNEHGEFKEGSMAEAKEAYSLDTFGRIFSITRQALINDDLDAFGDAMLRFGRAAIEFENQFLVDLLTSNPTLAQDSVALFHANHGNLGTGAPSALQQSALSDARKAMRLQKGLDKSTPIDCTPKFLLVPAALETTAEQLLAALTPNQVSAVNPFSGKLELVVDPRLDAKSTTAWYLAADPSTVDTIEYAYLEGNEGPQLTMESGFEVAGMRIRVLEDFGGGVLDFRGLYKANGA